MSLEEILDTQDTTPAHDEKTAARLRFADAAEALLRSIFAALGARNAHTLDVADVLSGLGAWLAELMTMTRFREGDAAVIWLDARRIAWERAPDASGMAAREEASAQADAAVCDFYQRFPPSLDTRDAKIEALQEEAHGLRAIADAAEDRAEKAERELAELRALVANGALIAQPKPERVEPGQRWAFVMTALENAKASQSRNIWKFADADGEVFYAGPRDFERAQYLGPAPTAEA